MAFLSGKKTYIIAAIGAAVVFMQQAGFLDSEQASKLIEFLGLMGLATLRSAVGK